MSFEDESHAPESRTSPNAANQWAMILHFSVLAGILFPVAGLVAPIVLWQLKRQEFPSLDAHAYVVINWLISLLIYGLIGFVLTFVLIGIPLLLVLTVLSIAFPIIGGIKAGEGRLWPYPLTIRFLG